MMAIKGADPAKWNWQLADKQEGFFPVDEAEEEQKAPENNGNIGGGMTEEEF